MSAINLNQLLHNGTAFTRVCIPRIQRDYAEGRKTDSVEKKRFNMLSDMLRSVFQDIALSLDFVYGKLTGQTFEPLDGQQRLTTLFVLHWLLGRNNDLKDSQGHSLFVYQTRKTSEEFCHWLVNQNSNDIIKSWRQEVVEAEKLNNEHKRHWNDPDKKGRIDKIANRLKYPLVSVPTLFDYFMEMDDFKWDWHVDPNIRSIIVVLETAYGLIHQQGKTIDDAISINCRLNNISFEILKDLKCDGEELFEKMNARGKALSSYDLLKSSLEEELEIQQSSLSTSRCWQKAIDGYWINYCWDCSNIPSNPTLHDVERVEKRLETLLIRFIGKSFFKQVISYQKPEDGTIAPGQSLDLCIFKDCDNVAENYFKYAKFERNKKSPSFTQLNLQDVYEDINNLIYTETVGKQTRYKDIAKYLHDNGLKMHANNNNTLLDDFLDKSLGHETRVIFYAMMAYLKYFNAEKLVKNPCEFSIFKDWMRFARNVFMAANKNVRIDTPDLVKEAISAIDVWLSVFFTNYHKGQKYDEMLCYIANVIVHNNNGQEQARLDEESIKANLRLGNNTADAPQDWSKAIIDSEDIPYLWGQIIAPLSWAKINNSYDLKSFIALNDKLKDLLTNAQKDDGIKLTQACLCIKDYRFNGNSNWGSLGIMTEDRYISWKRHLRDCNSNGIYGELLNQLIVHWQKKYSSFSCDQFLNTFINMFTPTDWRKYICKIPCDVLRNIFKLVRSNTRYVNFDNNNLYFYRSQQLRIDAIRYELLSLYLYHSVVNCKPVLIEHVNGGAYLELLTNNNDLIRITSYSGGLYDIDMKKGNILQKGSDADVINKLQHLGVLV